MQLKLLRDIKDTGRYIDCVQEYSDFQSGNITVEHRSNNTKRDYLFVNKKQCKHIPTSGVEMVDMCKQLAKLVNDKLANEVPVDAQILVVGFAETATAIGNIVADNLCCKTFVMQTTREDVPESKQLISFEEEHSHATTQKLLIKDDVDTDRFLSQFAYILFVEDEISTGNTILNFINEFEKVKPGMKYGVASVCNWQSVDNTNKFLKRDIDTFALLRGQMKNSDAKMFRPNEESKYIKREMKDFTDTRDELYFVYSIKSTPLGKDLFKQERLGHTANRNLDKLLSLVEETVNRDESIESVRVVGTEEFMYIPIKVAEFIEKELGKEVICHSTTRSPIDVMDSLAYGCADAITSKNKVPSAYDINRDTYLYNVDEKTDLVIILTDGSITEDKASAYYRLFEKVAKTVVICNL